MRHLLFAILAAPLFVACGGGADDKATSGSDTTAVDTFVWQTDQFGDTRILRYQVPGWDNLTLKQKQLCY